MSKTVETDLFLRLMRLSATTRNDLLEYIGQAPALTEDLLRAAESGTLHERLDAATTRDTKKARA